MAEALAHLQRAALEMGEAARAVLDVAEDLVREPAAALLLAGVVGEALRSSQSAATRGPSGEDRPSTGGDGVGEERDADGSRAAARRHVEHVRVAHHPGARGAGREPG